jgi:hypothetical protein
MASYRGHLMFAAPLGAAYGSLALLRPANRDWGPAFVAFGLTTLGGLLPDLDSDSGVPVRELFGVLAALVPALLYAPLRAAGMPLEQTLVLLGACYLFIRYAVAAVFRRFTVHRGMFHSIPALLIAGLSAYLCYPSPDPTMRAYMAGGVMVGFLSHLLLDELCSVDFMGARLKKSAGTAFKFGSPSWPATLTAYALLAVLTYLAWADLPRGLSEGLRLPPWLQRTHARAHP